MDWLDLFAVEGLSRVFFNTTIQKQQFFGAQTCFIVQLSHPYMTTGKTIAFTRQTFAGKVMSLLFNMLSRLVITFLSTHKCLFNFMTAVTIYSDFGTQKIKSVTLFIVSASICHEVMGPDAMILVF